MWVLPDSLVKLFQSTLPVWGGTRPACLLCHRSAFQSTLPVWGGTWHKAPLRQGGLFQSTLPVWGGTPYPDQSGT